MTSARVVTLRSTAALHANASQLPQVADIGDPDHQGQKMMGAIIMRMSLMNPSPSGFICSPSADRTGPARFREDGHKNLKVKRPVKFLFSGRVEVVDMAPGIENWREPIVA